MAHSANALGAIREAEAAGGSNYPFSVIIPLVKAVVLALLAISVAVEAATPGD